MSLNRARPDQPAFELAASAVVSGRAHLGAGALLAQGVVVRSHGGSVSVGNRSAVLENGVLVGWPDHPVDIGQRTVFGHRATVLGARVGNLCEIGNGAILLPGARLGDGCILGEGTLIPGGWSSPITPCSSGGRRTHYGPRRMRIGPGWPRCATARPSSPIIRARLSPTP